MHGEVSLRTGNSGTRPRNVSIEFSAAMVEDQGGAVNSEPGKRADRQGGEVFFETWFEQETEFVCHPAGQIKPPGQRLLGLAEKKDGIVSGRTGEMSSRLEEKEGAVFFRRYPCCFKKNVLFLGRQPCQDLGEDGVRKRVTHGLWISGRMSEGRRRRLGEFLCCPFLGSGSSVLASASWESSVFTGSGRVAQGKKTGAGDRFFFPGRGHFILRQSGEYFIKSCRFPLQIIPFSVSSHNFKEGLELC